MREGGREGVSEGGREGVREEGRDIGMWKYTLLMRSYISRVSYLYLF